MSATWACSGSSTPSRSAPLPSRKARSKPTASRPPTSSASDPSAAGARLQVVGCTCHLADPLPALKCHSDWPDFDHLDRSAHVCRSTTDVAHLLLGDSNVNASLTNVRGYNSQLPCSCPLCACVRPEATFHASAMPLASRGLAAVSRSLSCARMATGRGAKP